MTTEAPMVARWESYRVMGKEKNTRPGCTVTRVVPQSTRAASVLFRDNV